MPRGATRLQLLSVVWLCACQSVTDVAPSPSPLHSVAPSATAAHAAGSAAVLPVGLSPPEPEASSSAPAASSSMAPHVGPTQLLTVERYGAQNSARVVIVLSGPSAYRVGRLAPTAGRGPRLYIDLPDIEYTGTALYEVGGLAEQVRLGEQQQGARVVLDLEQSAEEQVFHLPEPYRVVVDVVARSQGRSRRSPKQMRRVVLDPGHGGHDAGASGPHGLREKDVALDVAHRAAPLIARELGLDALLTRDGDEYVALDERVAKANAFMADLFISIHCNASESSESHGVMSFVLEASRDVAEERLAARENATSEAATVDFTSAVNRLIDAATARRSLRFAQLLQRASLASLADHYAGVVDGGVRRAGFFVLAGAQMPAVLFEASFISNPTEELRLDSPRYRQRLADGIVNAIRAYRDGR